MSNSIQNIFSIFTYLTSIYFYLFVSVFLSLATPLLYPYLTLVYQRPFISIFLSINLYSYLFQTAPPLYISIFRVPLPTSISLSIHSYLYLSPPPSLHFPKFEGIRLILDLKSNVLF